MTRIIPLLVAGSLGAWTLADGATPTTAASAFITIGTAIGVVGSILMAGVALGKKLETVAATNRAQTKKLAEVEQTVDTRNAEQLKRIGDFEEVIKRLQQRMDQEHK